MCVREREIWGQCTKDFSTNFSPSRYFSHSPPLFPLLPLLFLLLSLSLSRILRLPHSLPLTLYFSLSLCCWVFVMNTGCGLNNPCTAILSRSYDDSQFDLLPLNDQQKLLFIAFCLLRPKSLIDSMARQHIVITEKV